MRVDSVPTGLLRLPPEPHTPTGDTRSSRVFRARRDHYRYPLLLTISFANVRNVSAKQGRLQGMLGLAAVEVRTAGGGAVDPHDAQAEPLHVGSLTGMDNEARDPDILTRLRRYRDSGLGDPDAIEQATLHSVAEAAEEPHAVGRELRESVASNMP